MINICSPSLHIADSYGLIATQLQQRLGVGVQLSDHQRPRQIPAHDGSIFCGWPIEFADYEAWTAQGPRIALTMWESSKLPQGWAGILNSMDAVVTPSQFCADVFSEAGVTTPIHVAALGVGEAYQPRRRAPGEPIRFLAFLDRGRRKGGHVAYTAFKRAFGEDKRYRLILKQRQIKDAIALFPVGNVELVQENLNEAELAALYQSCDVLINPCAGEGFGLLPREFAATGGVSLTTRWSGTADDLDQWGWELPYELGPADWTGHTELEGQSLGNWAWADVNGVTETLKQVAAQIDSYTDEAYQRAQNVHNLYSWQRFADVVGGVIKGLQ